MAWAAPSDGLFDDVHLDRPISLRWDGGDIRIPYLNPLVHVWFTFAQEAPFGMRCSVRWDF